MTFKEYQVQALTTSRGKEEHNELFHRILGLVGETGELAEKLKKWVRDENSQESSLDKQDLEKELGDVLWYIAILADYLELDLEQVASTNLEKLASRKKRGVLNGKGDNR